ncbi:hypothetical protein GEV29_11110 [Aeromicrobium sp. SMF47]|uniref:hypothetical protein n=1 Tax=Aeromicrobium yanjiei TaxID=2662028 RepID=UPI00129EFD84|nr:hypothetical protein [Aeromicrobium yanjiei]MRJ77091.1 hypothetical protein [Aeromicrobium yanjiei]
MSVDTEIEGSPSSVESVATWLRNSLAPEIADAADGMNDARKSADDSWQGPAGDQFSSCMSGARDKTDSLESATKKMAEDLDDFAEKLRGCQNDMATIRSDATAAGLTVVGFMVQDPGPGPERPPDGFTGTPEEVTAHNAKVTAYDTHQDKIRAYNHASSEAARIDRKYATACRSLQDDYTVGQHASWLLTTADILGDAAVGALGVAVAGKQSKLNKRAADLVDEARRAIDDLQAHPERYMKRKWIFFKSLDTAKLEADRLALAGKLDEAEDLLRQSRLAGEGRVPKVLGRFGKVLGPIGLGLGAYNDYQEGETTTQIVVSQGASAGAGLLVGAGATVGTSALVGATIGSVIPGAGTAVGAVVGTVVGAGIAIFSDGAIDSLFENGPDVGKAFDEGVDALKETGGAIKDGVSGVAGKIGGLFD